MKILLFAITCIFLVSCTLPSGATGEVNVPNWQASPTPTSLPLAQVEIPKVSTPVPLGKVDVTPIWSGETVGACFNTVQISGGERKVDDYLFYEIVVNGKSHDHDRLKVGYVCMEMQTDGVFTYTVLVNGTVVTEQYLGQESPTAGTIYIMP